MSGRLAPVAAVALALGIGWLGGSCYHVPEPGCGFVCGPDGACPADYTCADDHRCHRNGTPASLVCGPPDAAVDAAPDAAIDAPPDAASDAAPDAAPDAAIDAAPDAAPDAPSDAAPDAAIDAAPPAHRQIVADEPASSPRPAPAARAAR